MFDTMTITKAGAAVCGSLLIFLFGAWGADALYSTEDFAHGVEEADGEEHHGPMQGYVIANLEATDAGGAEEEAGPSFEEVFATADAAAGEKVFSKCKSCHKVDGSNGTGPHLDGVVGRAVASVDGFGYSDGMIAHGGDWTPAELNEFLLNPKAATPGTKMTFSGLKDIEDRANLIAWLETQN